uniref:BPTI/Kunitz inhibitor domain-containing protein n=1 Tax=Mola mola TaxID=94237 RepID=A0A3Q3WTV6_MOLML
TSDLISFVLSPPPSVICRQAMKVGPCRGFIKRYYYSVTSQSCQVFIYGGCKANGNNFVTKDECEATCTNVRSAIVLSLPAVTVFPSAKKADVGHEHCLVSPDAGPCRAAMPMFYYHPITGTCRSFIYGGCRGNNNRYNRNERNTQSDCTREIIRRASSFLPRSGFFLFITLAAISALLLLAFIIVMLRRRSLYRRPSSIR